MLCTLAQCGQYPALDDFSFTLPKVVIKRNLVNINLKGKNPVKIEYLSSRTFCNKLLVVKFFNGHNWLNFRKFI